MTILAAITALFVPWTDPTPGAYIDGKATYYSARRMEEVARNRGMELDGAIGFVAMNRAGDLGRLVWLECNGDITGPYRVVDCAQRGAHYEAREERHLIVEVSFEQAHEWNMIKPIPIRVWFMLPWRTKDAPIPN